MKELDDDDLATKFLPDAGACLAAGAALAKPLRVWPPAAGAGSPYTVIPEGYKLQDLEDQLLAPVRKRFPVVTRENFDEIIRWRDARVAELRQRG